MQEAPGKERITQLQKQVPNRRPDQGITSRAELLKIEATLCNHHPATLGSGSSISIHATCWSPDLYSQNSGTCGQLKASRSKAEHVGGLFRPLQSLLMTPILSAPPFSPTPSTAYTPDCLAQTLNPRPLQLNSLLSTITPKVSQKAGFRVFVLADDDGLCR